MELATTWLKARFLNVGCGLWYVSDVCIAPQPTKKTFKSHFLQHETFNILLFSRSFLSMNVSGHLCSSVSCAAASFSYPLLIIRSCQIIWLLRAWSRNRKKQKKNNDTIRITRATLWFRALNWPRAWLREVSPLEEREGSGFQRPEVSGRETTLSQCESSSGGGWGLFSLWEVHLSSTWHKCH